jgi:hypothetical protein
MRHRLLTTTRPHVSFRTTTGATHGAPPLLRHRAPHRGRSARRGRCSSRRPPRRTIDRSDRRHLSSRSFVGTPRRARAHARARDSGRPPEGTPCGARARNTPSAPNSLLAISVSRCSMVLLLAIPAHVDPMSRALARLCLWVNRGRCGPNTPKTPSGYEGTPRRTRARVPPSPLWTRDVPLSRSTASRRPPSRRTCTHRLNGKRRHRLAEPLAFMGKGN